MSAFSFYALLSSNIGTFTFSVAISIVVYFFLYAKLVVSIIDPLCIAAIGSCFGFSVVVFLALTQKIRDMYILNYALTQFSFMFALILASKKKYQANKWRLSHLCVVDVPMAVKDRIPSAYISFLFLATFVIINQSIAYVEMGVPIFLKSRLEIYTLGGGVGILNRINNLCKPVSLYYCYYIIFIVNRNKRHRILAWFYFVILVVFGVLSGSRSSFIYILNIFFVFLVLNPVRENMKGYSFYTRYFKLLLLISVFFAIGTILLQSRLGLWSSIFHIFQRLVSYGDTYFYGYPSDTLQIVRPVGLVNLILGDLLRTLRLVPDSFVQTPIGFELFNKANGTTGVLSGPNPRHNVLGLINFGFAGSIFFSYACGLSLGMARNYLFYASRGGWFRKIVALLIYLSFTGIETDAISTLSVLTNMVIVGSVVGCCVYVLRNIKPRQDKTHSDFFY